MNFYLLPIETHRGYRAPRYVKARFFDGGQEGYWSLKDFGHTSSICLIGTDITLRKPDAFRIPANGSWSRKDRADLAGFLKGAGIKDRWVTRADNWREGLHRIAGMTQVLQSAYDDPMSTKVMQDPSRWLGRGILFGQARLAPLDMMRYFREEEEKRFCWGDWILYGRQWVDERRGIIVPVIAGGALPATDTFTAATDQVLTTYSANWTMNINTIMVIAATDTFRGNNLASESAGFHNVETYNNNQRSQVTIPTIGGSDFCGVAFRCGTGANYYAFYEADTSDYLFKNVASTVTTLGSSGGGGAAGDTIAGEAEGTTIRPIRNGSVPGTPGAQTDSSLSSGKAGISAWVAADITRGDNFEGSNLASGSLVYNRQKRDFRSFEVR